MFVARNLVDALATIIDYALWAYMWAFILRAVLSWVSPDPYNPIVRGLYAVTEPVLSRLRRKLPLFALQQQIHRLPDGGVHRNGDEPGDHHLVHDDPPARGPGLDHGGFLGRPEVDEGRDQDAHRGPVHEGEDPADDREQLPDTGGDPGGADHAQSGRERRTEHPAAVHGVRRDQIEEEQPDVRGAEQLPEAGILRYRSGTGPDDRLAHPQPPHAEARRDHRRHRRAGEGDQELLTGFLRQSLEARQAADR